MAHTMLALFGAMLARTSTSFGRPWAGLALRPSILKCYVHKSASCAHHMIRVVWSVKEGTSYYPLLSTSRTLLPCYHPGRHQSTLHAQAPAR
jgi:hypothetical protein